MKENIESYLSQSEDPIPGETLFSIMKGSSAVPGAESAKDKAVAFVNKANQDDKNFHYRWEAQGTDSVSIYKSPIEKKG